MQIAAPTPLTYAGHEIGAGVATTVVALTLSLSFGLVTFAAVGTPFSDQAVASGLLAGLVGQVVAALSRDGVRTACGPRSSTSLLLAGLVLTVLADPALRAADAVTVGKLVLGIAGMTVLASGLLQVLFGLAGAGRLARYAPYPFLAGFMCGIAGLIVIRQLPIMLGMSDLDTSGAHALARSLDAGALAVGAVTLVAINVVGRRWPRLPALALGTALGIAAYVLLADLAPRLDFGPGAADMGEAPPLVLTPLMLGDAGFRDVAWRHAVQIATTAVLIAAIGAMDGLLTAVAVDNITNGERSTRAELVRTGLANVACGIVGALPIALSSTNVMAVWRSGGRTRLPAMLATILLAVILMQGATLLGAIPQAVLGGVMIAIAASLVDHWTRGLVARLRSERGRHDRLLLASLAVVVIVAAATIFTTMVLAVVIGLLLSMALLLASMHQSLVRAVVDGNARPSRRVWPGALAGELERIRAGIRVVEIQGALFFGSAERLCNVCDRLAREAAWIVVDFGRVTTIDATGAVLLDRLARRLSTRGRHLLLAGVTPHGLHGSTLRAYGAFAGAESTWFADVDRAVEHAEVDDMARTGLAPVEVPLEAMELVAGLDHDALARVRAALRPLRLPAGTALFRENDPGDRLFLLARGRVSVTIALPGGGQSRIATFAPGAVFGEAALLDGRPRSGSAVVDEDATLLALDRPAFDALRGDDPALACRLLDNLARVLSARLRTTTNALRRLEDSLG